MRGGDIPEIPDESENKDELELSEIPLTCTELLVLKKLYGYTTENADTLQITVHKGDRKSTRLNSSHSAKSRMPSSA